VSGRICPRCGEPFSYIKRRVVNGRVYLYAVHYHGYVKGEDGKIKKITRECYLGPEESYVHASKTHQREGLKLKGLSDSRRFLEYLDRLLEYATRRDLDPALKREVASRLERALARLRE